MMTKAEASPFRLAIGGLNHPLRQGENLIGRATDSEVRITSAKVSRRHARITVDGETALVEDLESKNGTFVGDTRIDRPTALSHGDLLRLGQLTEPLRVVITNCRTTVTELSREGAIDSSIDG